MNGCNGFSVAMATLVNRFRYNEYPQLLASGLLLEIKFPISHLYGLGAGVLFGVALTATALGRSGE